MTEGFYFVFAAVFVNILMLIIGIMGHRGVYRRYDERRAREGNGEDDDTAA